MTSPTKFDLSSIAGFYGRGSLRLSDVCESMVDCCNELLWHIPTLPGSDDPGGELRSFYLRAEGIAVDLERLDLDSDTAPDELNDLFGDLDMLIGEISGGAFTFGAHEGDGSDFGIWPTDW